MFIIKLLIIETIIYQVFSSNAWNYSPNSNYHIQTDEGPERYFKYQTNNGQYRQEKRLEDGTVIGTYGWIDARGLLLLNDYIADNAGYRILKSRSVYVGHNRPIQEAIAIGKKAPFSNGILATPTTLAPPLISNSIETNTKTPYVEISPNSYKYTPITSSSFKPIDSSESSSTLRPPVTTTTRPFTSQRPSIYNSYKYLGEYTSSPNNEHPWAYYSHGKIPQHLLASDKVYNQIGDGYTAQFPEYNGVSVTQNGFRYYLPKQYHEEETLPGNERTGSFGYVDPFGIRRVIYYNSSPDRGFLHKKNNRYVGHNATPYDPRPY